MSSEEVKAMFSRTRRRRKSVLILLDELRFAVTGDRECMAAMD